MTPAEIRAAIVASPALRALVPNTEALAAALSSGRTRLTERLITERRIIAALGIIEGDAFLTALEGVGTAVLPDGHPLKQYQSGLARVLTWLKTDEGLDVGDPLAQTMLSALSDAGVVDPASAATVRALAEIPDPISELDVRRALFADDGALLV